MGVLRIKTLKTLPELRRTTQQAEEASISVTSSSAVQKLCSSTPGWLHKPKPACFHIQIVTTKATLTFFLFFSFFFCFNQLQFLCLPKKKMLNCTDKLLHDHQNSSSCLILLGNFSTVLQNLGFTEVNMKDLSLRKTGCLGFQSFGSHNGVQWFIQC